MYVVDVSGSDAERAVARLADHLGDRGRVATVERGSSPGPNSSGPTTVELGDDGWTARGTDAKTLPEALADHAPDHDYAVASGFPAAEIPQVVVGDAETVKADVPEPSEVLARAADADALDPASVADALEATEPHETLESLVARAKQSPMAKRSGAIATFTGRVRAKDAADDAPTEYLEFEKYEDVANEKMAAIRSDLEARDGVFEVLLHHRTGVVRSGEDIVFVVVLAGHREEAFRTVEDGINRLKDEVPLFKKEVTSEEQFWVHQRS